MRFLWLCLATMTLISMPGPVANAQLVDPTPDGEGESAPIQAGDADSIPLNPEDPTFNVWKTLRDDLSEGREPGPINIQKFYGGFGFTGIPSFFRLPVALTPEDLVAGSIDVLIMGEYTDAGGGMRGGAYGPNAVRNAAVLSAMGSIYRTSWPCAGQSIRRTENRRLRRRTDRNHSAAKGLFRPYASTCAMRSSRPSLESASSRFLSVATILCCTQMHLPWQTFTARRVSRLCISTPIRTAVERFSATSMVTDNRSGR